MHPQLMLHGFPPTPQLQAQMLPLMHVGANAGMFPGEAGGLARLRSLHSGAPILSGVGNSIDIDTFDQDDMTTVQKRNMFFLEESRAAASRGEGTGIVAQSEKVKRQAGFALQRADYETVIRRSSRSSSSSSFSTTMRRLLME